MSKSLQHYLNNTKKVNDCLEWQGCLNTDGYPRVFYNGNSNGKLHRIVYELVYSEDISGKVIRHTCDNPKCINPVHLISGTPYDNARDRDSRGRGRAMFSADMIKEIRRLWATGEFTQSGLARHLNIHQGSVRQIVLKKNYLWVE